ncbi:MAG: UbiA prenyltransferase family protein [Verrucomicrobia bacterium]|nr:UbiA prenyltransferase family protein [Cytophagales bacterium]
MLKKATLLHLRIPFSFFLMPVFAFALSLSEVWVTWKIVLIFVILHVFLYPASNGFNSFYDKDEDSIGGLKYPPKVSEELLWTSLIFDGIALALGVLLGWQFVIGLLIYGLVSKAYSWDKIRLKKYPFISWTVAGFFQGFFTFLMVFQALNKADWEQVFQPKILTGAFLSSVLLWGFYPMTQVYQHKEDARRGDMTLSRVLGIKGTFAFTALLFGVAMAGFYYFFNKFYEPLFFYGFQFFLLPSLVFFLLWFFQVNRNLEKANFDNTMRLNMISSVSTNSFFLLFAVFNYYL